MAEQHPAPGWYRDPTSPTDGRYWDGTRWTDAVSRAGQTITIPMDAQWAEVPPVPGSELRPPAPVATPPPFVAPVPTPAATPGATNSKSSSTAVILSVLAVALVVVVLIVVLASNGDSDDDPAPPATDAPPATEAPPSTEGG